MDADALTDSQWWLQEVLPSLLRVGLVVGVGLVARWLLLRAVDRAVATMADMHSKHAADDTERRIVAERKAQRTRTLGSLFHNIVTIAVFSIVVMMILSEFGVNLGPLIASAGIAGVALGFGAQSLVADFLSGIFILMEDQYGVGDVVDVGDATGVVEEVQLRITKVRAVDGSLWFVRNGEILRVGNMSQGWSRTILDIGVAYGTDVARAKEVLRVVGADFADDPDWEGIVLEPPDVWGVEQLAADSVVIRMVVKTRPGEHFSAARELRERIKRAFEANGIEIPFPQRVMWMRQDGPGTEPGAAPGTGGR